MTKILTLTVSLLRVDHPNNISEEEFACILRELLPLIRQNDIGNMK